jgi:hypothetical protein
VIKDKLLNWNDVPYMCFHPAARHACAPRLAKSPEQWPTSRRNPWPTSIGIIIIDAIHDENGKLIGFGKVTRDITERRQTQKALEEAREALFQAQKMEAAWHMTSTICSRQSAAAWRWSNGGLQLGGLT